MRKLHFEVLIAAKPEAVWDAIVDDKKYREWTSVFQEGSHFEGGWNEGDKIQFLTLNEKGEKEGMFSEIAKVKNTRLSRLNIWAIFQVAKKIPQASS